MDLLSCNKNALHVLRYSKFLSFLFQSNVYFQEVNFCKVAGWGYLPMSANVDEYPLSLYHSTNLKLLLIFSFHVPNTVTKDHFRKHQFSNFPVLPIRR